jgi:hypothetical protein
MASLVKADVSKAMEFAAYYDRFLTSVHKYSCLSFLMF